LEIGRKGTQGVLVEKPGNDHPPLCKKKKLQWTVHFKGREGGGVKGGGRNSKHRQIGL